MLHQMIARRRHGTLAPKAAAPPLTRPRIERAIADGLIRVEHDADEGPVVVIPRGSPDHASITVGDLVAALFDA